MIGLSLALSLLPPANSTNSHTTTRYVLDIHPMVNGQALAETQGGFYSLNERPSIVMYPSLSGLKLNQDRSSLIDGDGKVWNRLTPKPTSIKLNSHSLKWKGRMISLPSQSGTHFVAAFEWNGAPTVAIYGAGVGIWKNGSWSMLAEAPTEPTALLPLGKSLLIGTKNGLAVWKDNRTKWVRFAHEPADGNAISMAWLNNHLYAATATSGILSYNSSATGQAIRWGQLPTHPKHPSQVMAFAGRLIVRNDDLTVRVASGAPILALSRIGQIGTIAACGDELLLGGSRAIHIITLAGDLSKIDVPELNGQPPTALLKVKGTLFIGTQNQGLLVRDTSGKIQQFSEFNGLKDDWVTVLDETKSGVFVGTFIGGGYILQDSKLNHVQGMDDSRVTGITTLGDQTYVSNLSSVFRLNGVIAKPVFPQPTNFLRSAIQCLATDQTHIWVGTANGMYQLSIDRGPEITGRAF